MSAAEKPWELDVYYDPLPFEEERKLEKAVKGEWIGGGGGPSVRSHAVFAMSDCDKAMKQGEAVVKKFNKANVSFAVRGRYTGALVKKCPPKGQQPEGPNAPAFVPESQQLVRENTFYVSPYGSKGESVARARAQGSGTRRDFYRSPYEPSAAVQREARPERARSALYVSPYKKATRSPKRRKKVMASTPRFKAAVRAHLASARSTVGLAKRLRGAGGQSKVYKNGWVYITTKPAKSCGAAKKAVSALAKRLKKSGLKGSVGLMMTMGKKEKRLRKCPR